MLAPGPKVAQVHAEWSPLLRAAGGTIKGAVELLGSVGFVCTAESLRRWFLRGVPLGRAEDAREAFLRLGLRPPTVLVTGGLPPKVIPPHRNLENASFRLSLLDYPLWSRHVRGLFGLCYLLGVRPRSVEGKVRRRGLVWRCWLPPELPPQFREMLPEHLRRAERGRIRLMVEVTPPATLD